MSEVASARMTRVGTGTTTIRVLAMDLAITMALVTFQHDVRAQVSVSSAFSTPPGRDVLDFERQVEAAVLRADITFLDHVCTDDFTYTHGDGWTTGGPILSVDTKSEWLASLPGRYSAREVDSQHVEIHGDVAITMGRVRARSSGSSSASRAFSFWYIRVYEKRDGLWRYLSHRTVHGPTYEE